MTRQEAMAALMAAFPGRNITVTAQSWRYSHGREETYYRTSVLPGKGTDDCTQERRPSLAEAVRALIETMIAPAPGPDQEAMKRIHCLHEWTNLAGGGAKCEKCGAEMPF